MNLRNATFLALNIIASPTVHAFSQFVEAQSPQNVAALIYGLLGLMAILFVTPLLQFYFAAVREVNQQLALTEQTRVLDTANTGIVYVAQNGTINFANETAINQLGKARSHLINQIFVDQVSKEFIVDVQRALTSEDSQTKVQVQLGQLPFTLEFGAWLKHGNQPYRIVTLNPNVSATMDTLTKTNMDKLLNQLSQTQGALEIAEKRLQQLIDFAPIGIGKIDNNHQILSANQCLIQRLKYNEDELKKGNIYKLFNDPEAASLSAKRLQKHKKLHHAYVELTTRDGDSAPTELTVDLFDPDREEYLFWMINYCDEQFQYDKFNALLENTGIPVAILTDKGFSKLNKKAYKFFQIENEKDITGLFPYSLALNQSKEKGEELAIIVETIRLKGGTKSMQWSHYINDEPVPCEITLVPVYKSNKLDSILCIWTDLRELEQAGVELRHTAAKLESLRLECEQKQRLLVDNEQTLAALKHTRSRLAKLEHEYASKSAENEALEGDLAAVKVDLERVKNQEAALSCQLSQVTSQYESAGPEHHEMLQTLDQAKSKIKSQEVELNEYSSKFTVMELNAEAEQLEISALHSQIDSLKQSISQKEQTNELLDYQLNRLETEHENATNFINKLTEQLTAQRKSTEIEEQKNMTLTAQSESDSISQLQAQLKLVTSDCAQVKQQLLEAKVKVDTELARTTATLEKAQKRVNELLQFCQQLEQENNQHTELIDNLMSQVSSLKDETRQQHEQLTNNHQQWSQQQILSQQKHEFSEQALAQEKQVTTELYIKLEALVKTQQDVQAELEYAQDELAQIKLEVAEKQIQQHNIEAQLFEQKRKERDYHASIQAAQEAQASLRSKLLTAEKHLTLNAKSNTSIINNRPDIESIVLPNRLVSWFDLNYFWANQPSDFRLSLSLSALLDEIDHILRHGDVAVQSEKMAEISAIAQQLVTVSKAVNAEQLIDLAQNLTRDCRLGMKENALVRWQPTRQALQKSQRVVYEQLQHV